MQWPFKCESTEIAEYLMESSGQIICCYYFFSKHFEIGYLQKYGRFIEIYGKSIVLQLF